MAAPTKLDAHNARVRDALILPFKRRIASLAIRTDIWKSASKPSADSAVRSEAQERARGAIAEIDAQVADLSDIKFPAETKTSIIQAELDKMKASYADLRKTLVTITAVAS